MLAVGYLIARATQTSNAGTTVVTHHFAKPSRSGLEANAARLRRHYERRLESVIEADARLMVRTHVFHGPIVGVTCTAAERGGTPVVNDTLHFNCIAIQRRHGKVLEGARYLATIDPETGTYSYHGG
jgi:hypothetical protein